MHKALAPSLAAAALLAACALPPRLARGVRAGAPAGFGAAAAPGGAGASAPGGAGAPAAGARDALAANAVRALAAAFVRPDGAGGPGEDASAAAAPGDGGPAGDAARPPRERGTRIAGGRGTFYVPSDLVARDGAFDLVVHFHGANETVEPRFDRVGLNAVLYTFNVGLGSGKYEALFPDGRALERTLAEAESVLRKRVPGLAGARVGRVALSAWSAGYGAVARVLAHPESAERVDAVLLADAPHAGFAPGTRQVSPASIAPYVGYGRRAAAGERLMVITHSQIETPDYASTTRTARAIVEALGLPEGEPEPGDDPKMVMYEREEAGDAHVYGFRGGDASAHCQHLYNVGRYQWAPLAARWRAEPALARAEADAAAVAAVAGPPL